MMAMVALSDRFPSLNPYLIRQMPIREFCIMLDGAKKSAKRSKRAKKYENWRPAGDDWF